MPDRWPDINFSSIAAIGFGLTAYGVGAERGYVTREQARDRTLTTLRFLWNAPQTRPTAKDVTGYRGFFYHFLDMEKGRRYQTVELSAIDTALMMAGVLFAQSYFDRDDPAEREIRDLADKLYRRVEWSWMQPRPPLIAMAWQPESGMHTHDYKGYEEAMILYVLALGSPTHAISPDAWKARIAQLQVGDVLRPGVHQLRAALHPSVLAHLDRLPRHPRRLHAREGRRLLREFAAGDLRAARVCHGESRTASAATARTCGG